MRRAERAIRLVNWVFGLLLVLWLGLGLALLCWVLVHAPPPDGPDVPGWQGP